jgi:ABC-2 type transport system permease protein/lipopolysaccharide transport system permease protein
MAIPVVSEPTTPGSLVVTDLSKIGAEPPDDSWYHHNVPVVQSLKTLWDHREIMYTLAERDFRAQYKQATLGVLWALLAPVATLLIFVVVFSRVKAFPTQGIPYALYAFVGILCWNFFSSSVGSGGNALLTNKALLAKTQFPRECFPLETMLVNALNTVLSWVPLAILFVVFGRAPAVATVWVPLFMLIEVLFAAGITLAISSLIVQMRDLVQVLPIIISLGIFATPVIWPFAEIPTHYHVLGGQFVAKHLQHGHVVVAHWHGGFYVNLQVVYGLLNPLGPVISSVRTTMLLGHNPSWAPLVAAAVSSVLYLLVGYRVFKRFEVNFADIA